MIVIDSLKTKMPKSEKGLNNRGFEWMLDPESNNKEGEKIFNFNLQKSISLFSFGFKISVSFTGSKNSGETKCTD